MIGLFSRSSSALRLAVERAQELLTPSPKLNLPPLALAHLQQTVVVVARRELGHGEEGGNNCGPDVVRYRRGVNDKGSWCAAFVSYAWEEAAAETGLYLPFKRSHGAQRLYKAIRAVGHEVSAVPRIGACVCWERPEAGAWAGHVGIVVGFDATSNTLVTVEGNRGRFPSRVAEFTYPEGRWLNRLIGIASLIK